MQILHIYTFLYTSYILLHFYFLSDKIFYKSIERIALNILELYLFQSQKLINKRSVDFKNNSFDISFYKYCIICICIVFINNYY